MSEDKVELKEGYWVRIGDDSYAIHRILSVSVVEPYPDNDEFWLPIPFLGAIGLGIFFGVKAESWIVGIVTVITLGAGAAFIIDRLDKRINRGGPRNVVLQLDKKGPRVVAFKIPKVDAEKMQREIEAIVAEAAKSDRRIDPGKE